MIGWHATVMDHGGEEFKSHMVVWMRYQGRQVRLSMSGIWDDIPFSFLKYPTFLFVGEQMPSYRSHRHLG